MVLTIFAGIAEFERALIHQRNELGSNCGQGAGRALRPAAKLTADQVALARRLVEEGAPPRPARSRRTILQCHPATLYREFGKLDHGLSRRSRPGRPAPGTGRVEPRAEAPWSRNASSVASPPYSPPMWLVSATSWSGTRPKRWPR